MMNLLLLSQCAEADWVEWTIKDPNAAKQNVETKLILTENDPLINGWFCTYKTRGNGKIKH